MLTPENITNAKREAVRLVALMADLDRARQSCPEGTHPKQTGAVRRASMDLTRALAELRRRSR